MITLKNITFAYSRKDQPALADISAEIPAGIHLLAGENGAGKTTLLHVIAGLLHPLAGECLVDGVPSTTDNPAEMGRVFLVEENMFFPARSIRDFASLHSRFYPRFSPEVFEENLRAFGLTGRERMKSQSLGNRKKSQLAYALALGVDVLLLDEPTNGLDIQSKQTLRSLIANSVGEESTVIVSTHTVNELENLFDGAVMISKAQLLFAAGEDSISERLAFRVTRMPDPEAIYSEIQVGRVLNILPADPDAEPTRVDWRLLYSSLYSPVRQQILNLITPDYHG